MFHHTVPHLYEKYWFTRSSAGPSTIVTTYMFPLNTCITQREFINDESSLNWDIHLVQDEDKLTS
jgi:hypothetical protein